MSIGKSNFDLSMSRGIWFIMLSPASKIKMTWFYTCPLEKQIPTRLARFPVYLPPQFCAWFVQHPITDAIGCYCGYMTRWSFLFTSDSRTFYWDETASLFWCIHSPVLSLLGHIFPQSSLTPMVFITSYCSLGKETDLRVNPILGSTCRSGRGRTLRLL